MEAGPSLPGRAPGGGARVFRWIVLLFLASLPVGLFWVVPVAGATATGTDVLLGGMVVAGAVVLAWRGMLTVATGDGLPLHQGAGGDHAGGLALLLFFGGWAALSSLWGYHGDYAVAKGLGYGALAAGASCIAWSGVGWRRALDAWLVGTAVTVAATLPLLVFGSGAWETRVAYRGGSIGGLPLARLRGPFLHPNGFGDYL